MIVVAFLIKGNKDRDHQIQKVEYQLHLEK